MPVTAIEKQVERTRDLITDIVSNFRVDAISSQEEYDSAINDLISLLLNAFKKEYEQINDHEIYKNIFLSLLRDKQTEYLQMPGFDQVLKEVRELHGQAYKTQSFFESILEYCKQDGREDPANTVLYMIHLSGVWEGWHTVDTYYLTDNVMEEKGTNKKTLTPEQKNKLLELLIEREDIGTLDGEKLATELDANVRYLMAVIDDLEQKRYIHCIRIAQYNFQVTVEAEGIDFYNSGGYVADRRNSESVHAANLFNAATFGNNTSIIVGTGNVQNISNTISKGDFAAVQKSLKEHGVADEDIEELREVIDNDNPKIEEKKVGSKVGRWMKKMLSKSLDETWKIGITTAGKILGDIIEQYYGIKH